MIIDNLLSEITVQPNSIVSRTLHADANSKTVLMALDSGQELSEHTASVPAIVQILQGEAVFVQDGERHDLSPGGWVAMPAKAPHSVVAKSQTVLLLILIKCGSA